MIKFSAMTKVLITGANGLLGQKLLALLHTNENFQVIATSLGKRRFSVKNARVKYYSLDITQRNDVFNIINLVKPDIIIHTAAMTNVDQCERQQDTCWEINVQSVVHLLHAAESCHSFFVHLSTDFIFAGEHHYLDEEATPNPINFYGKSKLQAEYFVQQSQVKYAILRTALVYGVVPGMSRSNIVLWVKNSLEAQKPIKVVDDQYRTPTLAEDLAMGCHFVANQQAEGIYNISGGEVLTPYQIALQVAEIFGLSQSLISRTDSTKFFQLAPRPPETKLVIGKAQSELGFQPHSFRQGLLLLEKQILTLSEFVRY